MNRARTLTRSLLWISLGALGCGGVRGESRLDAELKVLRASKSLREAVTVVSSVGDVYWPAPSPDGKELLYVSGESGNLDIWARDLVTFATRRLTDDPADDSEPSMSPDGERIAFVSRRDDAKGDVWVMNRDGSDQTRITGVVAAERSPVFAPDGLSLFISLRPAADLLENIYRIDLESRTPVPVTKDGGFDPSIDKSGKYLAYSKPFTLNGVLSTRIEVLRLSDGKTLLATDGRRPEAFPRFVQDEAGTSWLFYARYVEDDSRDGKIDTFDVPSLYRVSVDDVAFTEKEPRYSEPVTSGANAENLAAGARDTLYFVSQGTEHLEIQALPLDGLLPASTPTQDILTLADGDLSARLRRFLLRVVMGRGGSEAIQARYELARDFAGEDKLPDAQSSFERLVEIAGPQTPLGRLSRLETIRNQFLIDTQANRANQATSHAEVAAVVAESDSEIVRSRAAVVLAEMDEVIGRYGPAMERSQTVTRTNPTFDEDATRADALEARVGTLALSLDEQAFRLLDVMQNHPTQVRERRMALDRLTALLPKTAPERVALLTRLLERAKTPAVRSPLLRRYSDTLLEQGEAVTAVTTLRAALTKENFTVIDQARMRLALATAEEAADQPEAAIDTLEVIVTASNVPRAQRDRARSELMRIALVKARRDEKRGDIQSAYTAYRKLADNNPQEPAAIRKVIVLGNQIGRGKELLAEMADRASKNRFDKVATYAHALAASFTGDIPTTKRQVEAALSVDRNFAWARMLRGWLFEREGHRTAFLDAADEYDKALLKFERSHDDEGVADAALNTGNALLGAGQPDQAFELYVRREHSRVPFQNRGQELVFLERFGQSAIRAQANDVALTALRDAVRLAVSEGDERRLGRLRGLVALAYQQLEMPEQARTQLLLARDDYASRGELDRVVVLDRTLAALFLANGDDAECIRALERAEQLRLEGHGPKGFSFGTLSILLPIAKSDTSRAPYGFGPLDEDEILRTLYGRLFLRLVDLRRAELFLSQRLTIIDKIGDDSVMGPVIVRERIMANAELMALSQRRGDQKQTEALATRALKLLKVEAQERVELGWSAPILTLLENRPPSFQAELSAELENLRKLGETVDPVVDASARRTALRVQALLARSREPRLTEPAPGTIDKLVAALDQQIIAAADLPSSQPVLPGAKSLQPASSPTVGASAAPVEVAAFDRRAAAYKSRDLLNRIEREWLSGDLEAGERDALELVQLAKEFSLYEVNWQLAYLRYRLGPAEQRQAALRDADDKLQQADLAARLLYSSRARPKLRDALVNALLHQAITNRDAPTTLRQLERRQTVPYFILPTSLQVPSAPEVERARVKLSDWRRNTLRALEDDGARSSARTLARLRDLFTELSKLITALPQPLATLATGNLDLLALQRLLNPGDRVLIHTSPSTDMIAISSTAVGFADANGQLLASSSQPTSQPSSQASSLASSQPTQQPTSLMPASQPASRPSKPLTYATRDVTVDASTLVTTAGVLAIQLTARSVSEKQPFDIGVGDRAQTDAERPLQATELAGNSRRAIRMEAEAISEVGLGAFRLQLDGSQDFDAGVYSADLPRSLSAANVVVVDGAAEWSEENKKHLVRVMAVAGSPSLVFCGGKNREASLTAARDLLARLSRSEDSRPKECELYGAVPGDAEAKRTLAEGRMKQQDAAAEKAMKEGRIADAVRLNEEALELARYLSAADKVLTYRARLGTQFARLRKFDQAVEYQREVIAAYEAAKETKNAAASWELLGSILSFGGRFEEAAAAFAQAITGYAALKSDVDVGRNLTYQGTAYRSAVRYNDAMAAFRKSAEHYALAAKPTNESASLQFAATVADGNFSNFALALELYQSALAAAERAKVPALVLRARVDVARTQRKLSRFDEAAKAVRGILRELEQAPPDSSNLSSRTEAQLELARIFWLRGNYERALNEVRSASALAEDARSAAKSRPDEIRADRFRIQGLSAEGLILMSQGKFTASTNRFRRALRLARIRNDRAEEATQLNNMGFVLRERGLSAEALSVFNAALNIDTDLKDNDGLAFDYRNIGVTHVRAGRLDKAKAELTRAAELNKKIGNRQNELQIRLTFAELALLEKDLSKARQLFADATAEATKLNFSDSIWRTQLGEGLSATGDERRVALEAAFTSWAKLGVRLDDSDAAQSAFNPLSSAHLVEALLQHYLASKDYPRLEHALEVLRLKDLREDIPAAVWLARAGLDADALGNELKVKAAAEEDALLKPLLLLTPESTLTEQPAGAYVVLRAVGSGVVWLKRSAGVLSAGLVPLPLRDLEKQGKQWVDAVRWMARPKEQPLFVQMRAVLAVKPGERLTVIGDKRLSRLPWAAMPLGTSEQDGYLVEKSPVVMALSISHAQVGNVTAFSDLSVLMPKSADGLPFGELEAKESLALWKELGRRAQTRSVAELPSVRTGAIHVALHGTSPGAGFERAVLRQGDSEVSAAAVMAERNQLNAVLLSSCQDVDDAPLGGEFVTAYQLSGAARVIAPVSRIYDDIAALFAKRVMRLLASNGGAEDFAKLQVERIKAGEPPAAWASYQYWGQ